MSNKLTILHYADTQLEVRKGGTSPNRYDEYFYTFQVIEDFVKKHCPDVIAIPGDIFEFNTPTDTERLLFINHLQTVVKYVKEIIITEGNHDCRQRFNLILVNGEEVPEDNPLESIVTALDNEKIKYFSRSGFYHSYREDLSYVVHSHRHKYLKDPNWSYNPWPIDGSFLCEDMEISNMVELYHDNFSGALDLKGLVAHGCESAQGFEAFRAPLILAGHIHAPLYLRNPETNQIFCYASSTVQRDQGEGDYWIGSEQRINSFKSHGYYLHTRENGVWSAEFYPIIPIVHRTTIDLLTNFDYQNSWNSLKFNSTKKNIIRLRVHGNEIKFFEYAEQIINHLKELGGPDTLIAIDSVSSLIAENPESEDIEINNLISESQIIEIAEAYIARKIRSSSSIPEEDKIEAQQKVNEIFRDQLRKLHTTQKLKKIKFDKFRLNNFLAFGDNIEISFALLHHIIRVSGTNGVGKTTIYKFIKWMIADVINAAQNVNAVNQNALDMFNDYRANVDETSGFISFYVNQDHYTVTKSVTRTWKKKVTDQQKSEKNWKDYISGIEIQKTLTISANGSDNAGIIITDPKLVAEKLQEIFGGLWSLNQLLFVDSNSLNSLLNTESNLLANNILYNLGLRFFSGMEADYDSVRKDKLSVLSKPNRTIEQINSENFQLDLQLNELKLVLLNSIDSVKSEEERIVVEQTAVEQLSSTLYNVGTVEEINQQIKSDQSLLAEKTNKLQQLTTLELELEKSLDSSITQESVNLIQSKLSELKIESVNRNNTVVELENQIITKQSDLIHLRERLTNSENQKLQLIKDQKTDNILLISKTSALISESKQSQVSIIEKYSQEKEQEITKITHQLELVKSSVKSLENEIERLNKQLLELQKSTVCSTCGQELKAEAILQINQKISEVNQSITIQSEQLIGKNLELDQLSTDLESKKLIDIKSAVLLDSVFHGLTTRLSGLTSTLENSQKIDQQLTIDIEFKSNEIVNLVNQNPEVLNLDSLILELQTVNLGSAKQQYLNSVDLEAFQEKLLIDHQKLLTNQSEIKDKLAKISTAKIQFKADQQIINSQISVLESQLVQAELNISTLNKITEHKNQVNQLKIQLDLLNKDYQKLLVEQSRLNNQVNQNQIEIKSIIEYRIMDSSLQIYKSLLGKNGLVPYVFDIVSKELNKKLNDLLQNLPYRLQFINGRLNLMDYTKIDSGTEVIARDVSFASQMQTMFLGLSLLYVSRTCNLAVSYDCLFIDEISGALNDGKELTYDAINYQAQLSEILNKMSEHSKLFVVDHVLEELNETSIIEVRPGKDGATLEIL